MSLEEMKDEVRNIAEEFASSLNFVSFHALRETAKVLKVMHYERNCSDCLEAHDSLAVINSESGDDADIIKSDFLVNSFYNAEIPKTDRKSFRKSRKSVCVLPKFISSSESSSSETENEEQDDDEYFSDSSPFTMSKKCGAKSRQFLSSDDDTDDDIDNNLTNKVRHDSNEGTGSLISNIKHLSLASNNHELRETLVIESENETDIDDNTATSNVVAESSDDEQNGSFDSTKKRIIYDSSDDESMIHMKASEYKLSATSDIVEDSPLDIIEKHTTQGNVQIVSSSDDEVIISLKDKGGERKPLTTFISSEEDNFDDYLGLMKKNVKKSIENEFNDDDSLDDFIVDDNDGGDDDDDLFTLKMPKSSVKPKSVLCAAKFNTFATPKSASRNVLHRIKTPKSVAGTPAYKREFNKSRDVIIKELFVLFNSSIFDNKLPADFQITWNKRMTKTAGFCFYSLSDGTRKSRIELSDKVIDSAERVRDTLIHELCHAATWLIDGMKAGHGPAWKYWAKKANKMHPDLPVIARCHQYEIHTKFNYQCNGCGQTFGRHSKSVDASRHRCSKCGGVPELVQSNNNSATPRTPNTYALFVKANFASVKKGNPGFTHKEIMQQISQDFKVFKLSKENKENVI